MTVTLARDCEKLLNVQIPRVKGNGVEGHAWTALEHPIIIVTVY